MKYSDEGEELPDRTPVEVPVKFKHPPSIQELVKMSIRGEMSRLAQEEGNESFEEADDFDVGDDEPLPFSKHELTPMQEEFLMSPPVKKEVKGEGKREVGAKPGGNSDVGAKSGKSEGESGASSGESGDSRSEGSPK